MATAFGDGICIYDNRPDYVRRIAGIGTDVDEKGVPVFADWNPSGTPEGFEFWCISLNY